MRLEGMLMLLCLIGLSVWTRYVIVETYWAMKKEEDDE